MTTLNKPRVIKSIKALSLTKKLRLCAELNVYIAGNAAGSLEKLATQCGITVALASDLMAYMHDELKCPIGYSEERQTYYYTRPGRLFIGFQPEAE
ncbi:hypothetical protein [Pedobacter sp. JY14-1]|uniref:hypothetical protein n=1 Tax=Pedobacter sp. JY14-1 TaxID=3034151 RepID=UPI0023E11C56|nr:hypothetical protein [Pedobacter sp. JY14-1]